MRISFLCGSLAPMRDGVGDYTRALAEECRRQGHTCQLIALNDAALPPGHVLDAPELLRLSATLPWTQKARLLTINCSRFQPDLLSWQIVPYGFSPKGIIPGDLIRIAQHSSGKRNHVMLHELCIGVEVGAKLRERLIGHLQRHRLLSLIKSLKPCHLHTSNSSYRALLSAYGIPAEILPLFGNIPITPAPSLIAETLPPDKSKLSAFLFGTLHPQWNTGPFAQWMHATARRKNLQPIIVVAGRLGGHGERKLKELRDTGLETRIVGEQPAEVISTFMQTLSFGLALHPWALIGKSGVAAAMLEHGLPVLVPRNDWTLRVTPEKHCCLETPPPLLLKLEDATPERTERWLANRQVPATVLPAITRQFIQSIACTAP